MATISSPGIGSGLDVKSIVSQLVAIERQPLGKLQVQAATVQSRISAFAQVKSLISTLSDAASSLNSLTTYNAVKAASSNSKAVAASAVGGTTANSFAVKVDKLAKSQATASAALLPVDAAIGAGTIRLQLGTWSQAPTLFTAQIGVNPVDIVVGAADTVADVASKINGASASVTATVLNDSSGQRLLLRSRSTGEAAGFELSIVSDADGLPADAAGLSRLVVGSSIDYAENAQIQINNIAVSSASNTFTDVISGVTLTAGEVSATAVEVTVQSDKAVAKAAVDKFVSAYNAVNLLLNDLTKYDPSSKASGLLQGDSTAIGFQSSLRGMLQSTTAGSAYQRLADIGVTQILGGNLAVDSGKLDTALANGDEVKKLFRNDNGNTLTNGVALKFKTFSQGVLAADGFFSAKDATLKRSLELNAKDQTRLTEKVARIETQLNRRYSALDVQLNSLTALNSYITQQVAQWNRSTT